MSKDAISSSDQAITENTNNPSSSHTSTDANLAESLSNIQLSNNNKSVENDNGSRINNNAKSTSKENVNNRISMMPQQQRRQNNYNNQYQDRGEFRQREHRQSSSDQKSVCRLLIPTRYAGVLIGKQGSIVNNLRTQFQCQVAIPYANGPERTVRIMSDDLTSVLECVQEISKLLAEDMRRVCNLKEDFTEVRVLVHQSQCGNIIGPGGEKINRLRETSNCNIKMNGECCPASTDRICQIAGIPEDVHDCLSHILIDLETVPIKGSDARYNPDHYDERYEYGGFKSYHIDSLQGPNGRGPRPVRQNYYRINNRR